MSVEPQGQQQFLRLAPPGARVAEEQGLCHLLGQGRSALDHPPVHQIDRGGAQDADRVDAGFGPEAPVLGIHRGLGDVGRQVGEMHRLARDVAEAGEHTARGVAQDQARAAGRGECVFRPRQVAREPEQEQGAGEAAPDRGDDGKSDQPPGAAAGGGIAGGGLAAAGPCAGGSRARGPRAGGRRVPCRLRRRGRRALAAAPPAGSARVGGDGSGRAGRTRHPGLRHGAFTRPRVLRDRARGGKLPSGRRRAAKE